MENIKLSIIVPIYNVAPYLRKCVDSLLMQECYQNHPSFQGRAGDRLVLPITEMLADCELSLPMSPTMTIEDAMEVVRLINSWK